MHDDKQQDTGISEVYCSPLKNQVGGTHYKDMPIQPVEFAQKNKLTFCEASAIKYICRHRSKNGVQDIDKAIHFLELLKQIEYPEQCEHPVMSETTKYQDEHKEAERLRLLAKALYQTNSIEYIPPIK